MSATLISERERRLTEARYATMCAMLKEAVRSPLCTIATSEVSHFGAAVVHVMQQLTHYFLVEHTVSLLQACLVSILRS